MTVPHFKKVAISITALSLPMIFYQFYTYKKQLKVHAQTVYKSKPLACELAYLPVGVTDQDHLLEQLAIWGGFGNDLPENQQQLFDGVVLKWQHKADYGHQQSWQLLTIKDHDDDLLQGLRFCFDLPLFCRKNIIINSTINMISKAWSMHYYLYFDEQLFTLLTCYVNQQW